MGLLAPEARHPNCSGNHPTREARVGPYDLGQCHLCWLALNEPQRVARLRAGTSARASDCTAPPASLAVPRDSWPRSVRLLARLRRDGESGVGDTLARLLARLGGEAFKRAYARITGGDCGCGGRQARLNALYPYLP